MPFFLLNPWMLLGLGAVAIPVIIHLLNRRRFEIVEWGAMQFLHVSEITRRKLFLEELLLMLLRMGLIAVLVLGVAAPVTTSETLRQLSSRPNRDVVLIFDGSASMGVTGTGKTAAEAARDWALAFVNDLSPGDGVAVFQARQQPVPVVAELTTDLERVRDRIGRLTPPAGGCDWPAAVQAAYAALAGSKRPEREIILLGDGQRYSWADSNSLLRWKMLASQQEFQKPPVPGDLPRPRLWVVNLDPDRSPDPPNWSLAPLRCSRPVVPVEREVTFSTELDLHGQKTYAAPYKIRLDVDGRTVRDLEAPKAAKLEGGKTPLSFIHRFSASGSHLVSVTLEPDPPPERRPAGYVIRDHVPSDNRQDFAVDVVTALPVLLVDGDTARDPERRGSDFIRNALSPSRDRNPVVRLVPNDKVVSAAAFTPAMLSGGKGGPNDRPRVLILCNVAQLTIPQSDAVSEFLADGGGVLVTLGDRVQADAYNKILYRDGKGWLPARLDGLEGDPVKDPEGVRPAAATFLHPALEIFRGMAAGGLDSVRFPRWWKLTTPGRQAAGVPVAALRSPTVDTPFLVERAYKAGRVLVCAVPLDNSWGTNLVDVPAIVPLAHELVYYLAGARAADFNLQAGQPLRWRFDGDASLSRFTLQPPAGDARPLGPSASDQSVYPAQIIPQPRGSLLLYENTRETGIYRLKTPEGRTINYVVQADPMESDLTPCDAADRKKVAEVFNAGEGAPELLRYADDRGAIVQAISGTNEMQEIWWWFLLGLVALLCGEVWMTRRLVLSR